MIEEKNKLIKSLKWTFIEQVFAQILSFSIGVILARLLSPKDFGLIAMITVFTGISGIFINMGLGSALIQRKELDNEFISTAFWINLLLGFFVFIIINLCNPLIVQFYGENLLSKLIPFVALNILLASFSIIPNALLTKNLNFKLLFRINIFAIFVAGSIAVLLANLNYGVWSLVAQSLILHTITALLLWSFVKFKPTLTFSFAKMKLLFDFSLPLLGVSSLTYLYRNIDSLLIGRKLGSETLGLYNKAYSLMSLPLHNINNAIGKAVFPSFAKMQDNKQLVRDIFFQAIASISIVAFPIMTMASILSFPIIDLVYGIKWHGSAPIFSVLAIAGAVQAISSLNGNIYLAFGKTKLLLKIGTILKTFNIFIIIFSLQWGVVGVSFGILIASILVLPINWHFINKILSASWQDYYRALFKISCIAVANSLLLYLLFTKLINLSSFSQFLIIGSVGSLLYFGAYEFFQLEAYLKLKELIKSKIK